MSIKKAGESSRDNQAASTSSDGELEDLQCLDFPDDVDWSSTLVLRCDPDGGPYNMADLTSALHQVVRRNEVFNLGPSILGHVFTISFKASYSMEGFLKFVTRTSKGVLKVKGHRCSICRVPSRCVTVKIRHIPLEVDTSHVVAALAQYGQVVKTEWVRNNFRGWFHVYTNERKFTLCLKKDVTASDLPYGIVVKGMPACVYVEERNPKSLECYYSGHKGDYCELKECVLHSD